MTRTFTLSLVAVGLLLSGTAVAQAVRPADGDGRDSARPEMTRDAVEQRATQLFARLDANADGKIDPADRTARSTERTGARFARLDSNGDGAISAEEFAAPREARPGRMAQGDAAANRGGGMGRGMGPGGSARAVLGQADTDNDGAVSQGEFNAALLARFDSADANSDGTVSRDERRAARPEGRRGDRDGRRGNRMHGQRGSNG